MFAARKSFSFVSIIHVIIGNIDTNENDLRAARHPMVNVLKMIVVSVFWNQNEL